MAEGTEGMRMAELSRQTGVSVATIKYYLREGLLAPGIATSANQALYNHSHVERIRLVRSLSKVAKLSLSTIDEVLKIIDGGGNAMEAMARTQSALVGDISSEEEDFSEAEDLLDSEIEKQGWHIYKQSPAYRMALRALVELQSENLSAPINHLGNYIQAADKIGETDIATLAAATSAQDVVRRMAVGTTLRAPLSDALILLAQQHHSGKNMRSFKQGRGQGQ